MDGRIRMLIALTVAALTLGAATQARAANATPAPAPVTITSLPWAISTPGTYILNGNLTGDRGIFVETDDVTIDLRGFTLRGAEPSGNGVTVLGQHVNLEIRNGVITGWSGHGIAADGSFNGSFHDLRLFGNGGCGLRAGHVAVVEHVLAELNGGNGIQGFEAVLVKHSMSSGNLLWGFDLGEGTLIEGASILHNGAGGLLVGSGAQVRDNAVRGNGWAGSKPSAPTDGCTLGSTAGIAVNGSGTLVERNTITANGIGLQLLSPENAVAGNIVMENGSNYDLVDGNQLELVLSELPETILWPANVTLSGTLWGLRGLDGLVIDTDGVTVDLSGHGLIGVDGSGSGIVIRSGRSSVVVTNGFVHDWGGDGISAERAANLRIEDVASHGNMGSGIVVGPGSSVMHSAARTNAVDGIHAAEDCVIVDCTATLNGEDGIEVGRHSTIGSTTASENSAFGILTLDGSTISHSTASRNRKGISVTSDCLVQGCTASLNADYGIQAASACVLLDNVANRNGIGISVTDGPGSRLDGNTLTGNTIGMSITGTGNLVVRNACFQNLTAYSLVPGNTWGPYVTVSSGALDASSPWANFQD